jgi:hypothetical protein
LPLTFLFQLVQQFLRKSQKFYLLFLLRLDEEHTTWCGEVFKKDEAVFFVLFCNELCDELFCVQNYFICVG